MPFGLLTGILSFFSSGMDRSTGVWLTLYPFGFSLIMNALIGVCLGVAFVIGKRLRSSRMFLSGVASLFLISLEAGNLGVADTIYFFGPAVVFLLTAL